MSFLSAKGGYAARAALLLALVFSAGSANAARLLYSGGAHALDNARIVGLGHTSATFSDTDAGWTGVFAGANGAFDAILVGENPGRSLSAGTKTAIASYVSGGGRIIVASDHAGNIPFMNSVFGYATTLNYGCLSDQTIAGTLQSGETATFAAGPPNVKNLSCTSALNLASVPSGAKSIYSGTATSVAFAANYGSGRFVWLGYDFFSLSATATNIDDWYLVLDNSIKFAGLFVSCSAEGYTGARLSLCRQVCEVPQTLTKLAGLVQLYTKTYRTAPPCGAVLATLR